METTHASPSGMRRAPELLAPAGNWDCAVAAIENGADAIYFGLQVGFNARARATNFTLDELPQLMAKLHQRGVCGYVTLNTLVFTDELPALERNVRAIAAGGVDAVLVQDIGAARLIKQICPELHIHASTQMTMTSAETIQVAQELGLERAVLARELSIDEIRKISQNTSMPIEVFVHGALCVAYSGQCLTSESLGGRSANRGQCAQACRLDYEMIVDNKPRDLGDVKYLLSPQDLAAYELIPQLIDAGVCSLKIEGRLKTPEYVANIVQHYRQAIDSAMKNQSVAFTAESKREMELSFSRGFSPGWLEGNNHKRLVPGVTSAKHGVQVGRVIRLRGERLEVHLEYPLAKGDGIVLEGDRAAGKEIGGRIYNILVDGQPVDEATGGRVELLFQKRLLRDAQVFAGQTLWQTDAPQLTKRLRATYQTKSPLRRVPIKIALIAHVGLPLQLRVTCENGPSIDLTSDHIPEKAQRHEANAEQLRQQLGRLGGSAYELADLSVELVGGPMIPLSVLGSLRHEMIERLDAVRTTLPNRQVSEIGIADQMLSAVKLDRPQSGQNDAAELTVLCRSLDQLTSALDAGARHVYADFHDIRDYRQAVERARAVGASIHLATLRIFKPGEKGLFLAMAKQDADGWLVRNLAAIDFAKKHAIPMVGDFSLNVTNPLSAQWFMDHGMQRITASYDLNRDQLLELVDAMPSLWLEVVVHQHMPMFHMEHCVFCSVISPGTNKSNCGRPCDRHDVRLKDRIGVEHILHADIGCRNTLYNGVAQSGAEAVKPLVERGVEHFRVELLRDLPADEVKKLVQLYQDLLAGKLNGAQVWQTLKAQNRLGVTRGTLEHPRNPLAIL
jgi:U32 family peptidase